MESCANHEVLLLLRQVCSNRCHSRQDIAVNLVVPEDLSMIISDDMIASSDEQKVGKKKVVKLKFNK